MATERSTPEQPFINKSGFLEYKGEIFDSEAEIMKRSGGEIMEDLDDILYKPVDSVARKYQVSFVHGTHPKFTPETAAQKDEMTWDEKVGEVLTKRPEVSCSSVKTGDSSENLWAGVGVAVKNGEIKNAFPQDMATIVDKQGSRERASEDSVYSKKRLSEKVSGAITQRSQNTYNEFTITNPEVAGLYFDLGRLAQSGELIIHSQAHISLAEFFEKGSQFNIPKYLFYKGDFYQPIHGEVEIEAVVDSRSDIDKTKPHTWPRISREEYKWLVEEGVFINDNYIISSSKSNLLFDEKKLIKLKTVKLGEKVDIYNNKDKKK